MSVLTFSMVVDATLTNLKIVEDEEFGLNMAVKELDCAIGECFCLQEEYGYIAN